MNNPCAHVRCEITASRLFNPAYLSTYPFPYLTNLHERQISPWAAPFHIRSMGTTFGGSTRAQPPSSSPQRCRTEEEAAARLALMTTPSAEESTLLIGVTDMDRAPSPRTPLTESPKVGPPSAVPQRRRWRCPQPRDCCALRAPPRREPAPWPAGGRRAVRVCRKLPRGRRDTGGWQTLGLTCRCSAAPRAVSRTRPLTGGSVFSFAPHLHIGCALSRHAQLAERWPRRLPVLHELLPPHRGAARSCRGDPRRWQQVRGGRRAKDRVQRRRRHHQRRNRILPTRVSRKRNLRRTLRRHRQRAGPEAHLRVSAGLWTERLVPAQPQVSRAQKRPEPRVLLPA